MQPTQPPATLSEIVLLGDRRASLEALRGKLAAAIDACTEPRDVAPLSRRLEAVLAQLEALPSQTEDGDVVAAFRNAHPSARRSGAARKQSASGSSRKRSAG